MTSENFFQGDICQECQLFTISGVALSIKVAFHPFQLTKSDIKLKVGETMKFATENTSVNVSL